jgi:hypothetical protein
LDLWATVEERTFGRGGVSVAAKAVDFSRISVYADFEELKSTPRAASDESSPTGSSTARRVRTEGGWRERSTGKDATLLGDIDASVESNGARIDAHL